MGAELFQFIFTSPTFIKEKAEKQKREFYIPRLSRETSLYGTEFEIKLRLEGKIKKERQPKKKFELVQQIKALKEELISP